ncbi:MAG: PD-(D/E)XK nuclease family protein [Solirubrobacteraceae bacterium]
MPLKLVLGPANSAKAGEVLGAFSALAPRGAVLVVPTAADALHYRRELAEGGSTLGAVLTFAGMGHEIARRVGYSARRLSAHQREALLRAALSGASLEVLVRSAGAPGFRRAAGELIAELQRGLVTPQRFLAALQTWGRADPRRSAYAEEVGRIYQRYARECDRRGWVDGELFAWRALDALRSAPGRWGRDAVFFYGFDELTPLERDAVETLSRIVGAEVTVSLNYEAGRAALQARAEAVAELTSLADTVLELPASDEHYAPARRAVLHHLERQLFEPTAERIDPGDTISLLEAGGERAEAELVAGEVLGLLRAGFPAEEIAVVYRSLSRAAPLLARVFAEYGIPLSVDYELPLVHTPLGRAVRGAARCALDPGASAGDLLAYLRAPGMLAHPEIADGLEAELRRAGDTSAETARDRLGWNLGELDSLRSAADPGSELCRLARRVLAAPRRGAAAVLGRSEALDARALAVLQAAIAELAELGQRSSPEELLELLDGLRVPAGASAERGEVRLAEPLQIRARRYRAVFVCGLQEGEFPVPARPEPFLSDERRRELAECSGLRLTRHEDVLDRERYLLYATVSRATEKVVLSYRSSDEEGNLAVASPFLADVAEVLAFDWPERRARRLLADVVWAPDRAPTVREQARGQAAETAPLDGDDTEPDRQLGQLALSRLRHTDILSAGALEAYSDCPVRWLIERELRPALLQPDPEPIVRGNLMHAVLEQLLGELEGPVNPGSLEQAQEILTRLLAELAGGPGAALGAGQPAVVRAGALRAIEADLRRYLRYEAQGGEEWRPFGLELRFGFEGEDGRPSLPPLALETEGGGASGGGLILVRGMIDRVDVDAGGRAVVRDYKSGNVRPDWPVARWHSDRRLQVALYLVVVRELTELDPVAGFYQPLRGDDLRPRGMFRSGAGAGSATMDRDGRSAEEFAAELDDAMTRATALAAALRAGHLEPCPQTCSRDGCAYPGICRSQ